MSLIFATSFNFAKSLNFATSLTFATIQLTKTCGEHKIIWLISPKWRFDDGSRTEFLHGENLSSYHKM